MNQNIKKQFNPFIKTIVITLVVVLISKCGFLSDLNNHIYDYFIYLNQSPTMQNDIIIVEIDNKSLSKVGKWPWSRKIHTEFLSKLNQYKPGVVGFYLKFLEETIPEEDKAFINSLKQLPTILIATNKKQQSNQSFLNSLNNASNFGHDVIPVDTDNVIRNQFLWLKNVPSFAMKVVSLFDNKHNYYDVMNKTKLLPINYKHSKDKFHIISYSDVLNGKVDKHIIENKIVLVGFKVKGLYDSSITPLSKHNSSGLEGTVSPIMLQAQIIDSLINFNLINIISPWQLYLLIFAFISLFWFLFNKQSFTKQVIVYIFALPAFIFIVDYTIFTLINYWIPPIEFIVSSLLCFSVLSIHIISTTSTFLDKFMGENIYKSDIKIDVSSSKSVDSKLSSFIDLLTIIQNDKNVLDTVLESINSSVILFNENNEIKYANNDRIFKDISNLKDLTDDIDISIIIRKINEDGYFKQNIILKELHYEFIVTGAKNKLFVGIFNDITDMVKMNEMKSNILHVLTHEIKSPLTNIILLSDMIKITDKKETILGHVDKIDEQTTFIETLIQNFLALNKLEITDYHINIEKISVSDLLTQVIKDFEIILDTKSIALQYINNANDPIILADKKYLYIAIKNLIDNAIKYSFKDSEVKVLLETENKQVKISIIDQGIGIAQEDTEKLFDKFYRADNITNKTVKGSGLGLSFVKKITESHNGKIQLTSKLNEGSIFTLYFPETNS